MDKNIFTLGLLGAAAIGGYYLLEKVSGSTSKYSDGFTFNSNNTSYMILDKEIRSGEWWYRIGVVEFGSGVSIIGWYSETKVTSVIDGWSRFYG